MSYLTRGLLIVLSCTLVACNVSNPLSNPARPAATSAVSFTQSPPAVPNADQASQYSGVTIVYYGDADGIGPRLDTALAQRFTQDTGIVVEPVRDEALAELADATDRFSVYERLFQAKSADIDVLLLDIIWPGQFAPHLADLSQAFDETVANQHFESNWQAGMVNNRLVAIPWFTDLGLLYYRSDLLKNAGFAAPPTTWDELEQMAIAIQEQERANNPFFWGYLFEAAPGEGLTCTALEVIASHGGDPIIDEQQRIAVDTSQALAALKRARGWINTITPPEVLGYGGSEIRTAFRDGNAAFMRHWPSAVGELRDTGTSRVAGVFGVAPLPHEPGQRSASTIGGQLLAVSGYSRQQEAAIEFVRYLTSPEVQHWRALIGSYVPTIRSVSEATDVIAEMPFLADFTTNVERVARPSSLQEVSYPELSQSFYLGVHEILSGQDPGQILTMMHNRVEDRVLVPRVQLTNVGTP